MLIEKMLMKMLIMLRDLQKAEFVTKATSVEGSKRIYVSENKEVLRIILTGRGTEFGLSHIFSPQETAQGLGCIIGTIHIK